MRHAAAWFCCLALACTTHGETSLERAFARPVPQRPTRSDNRVEVPPPPFSPDIFPCSDCHDGEPTNFTRREFTDDHKNIKLEHDSEHRWCLDCHNPDNRDVLRLASGVTVAFDESYRLCGQCHGDKFRDWRQGVHGRRSGFWNGAKTYLLCVHCHNPHKPKFQPLVPKPAPRPPSAILPHDEVRNVRM